MRAVRDRIHGVQALSYLGVSAAPGTARSGRRGCWPEGLPGLTSALQLTEAWREISGKNHPEPSPTACACRKHRARSVCVCMSLAEELQSAAPLPSPRDQAYGVLGPARGGCPPVTPHTILHLFPLCDNSFPNCLTREI